MLPERTNVAIATVTNTAGESIVYTIGGVNPYNVPLTTVRAYNVAMNTWALARALPVPLAGTNGAGVINGKIYVTGGYSDHEGVFPWKTVYMYNPTTNTWTKKRDMPSIDLGYGDKEYPAGGGVTGVLNGTLYVVSGAFYAYEPWGYFEAYHSLFFRYNPGTDQWTTLPPPFAGIPTVSPYAGGVIAGKFYVMAGSPYTHDSYLAVYDPASNRWTAKTALRLSRPGAGTATLAGKLYVIGGRRYNAALDAMDTLDKTFVYDPTTDLWTTRASMPSPRTGLAATTVRRLGKARIEVVGGSAPGNNLQYIP
jgi:N-acetylneuraminic acid mutarotase